MARILWIPSFQPGSYFPAVPIALELLAREHEVTALCEAGSEGVLCSLGCHFQPSRRIDSYQAEAGRPAPDPAAKRLWQAGYMRALFEDASEVLAASAHDVVMFLERASVSHLTKFDLAAALGLDRALGDPAGDLMGPPGTAPHARIFS